MGIQFRRERTNRLRLFNSPTIDENLRDFFLRDRSLLNCLFHSVNSVVLRMFQQINKSKNFTPGFLMVLHTFGRDLRWNPHIHCLISEGGFSDDGFWRYVKQLSFRFSPQCFPHSSPERNGICPWTILLKYKI